MGLDHVELADGSGLEEFAGFEVDHVGDALAAYLEDASSLVGGVDHGGAIGVEVDHGLFAVDVLARAHGVAGDLHVPVVGGSDEDGVDVGSGEDLVVVAGGEDVLAPELFGVVKTALVAV